MNPSTDMAEVDEYIRATAARLGVDFSTVDLDSIRLPPGENFGLVSDDEGVEEKGELEVNRGFGNVIVVDNLPVVPEEKFRKLEGVIREKFISTGGVVKEEGLWMPIHPVTKETRGYSFIEYNTPQEAKAAKENRDGYRLGRSQHRFAVNLFDEFDKFMQVSDEWEPPVTRPYNPGVWSQQNLQKWLTDVQARDQFVIRAGTDTEVFWNDARHLRADPFYYQTDWTESYVQWSPLGTYLATLHSQGVAIWGGSTTFNRLRRYVHPQVQLIDFSPGEKFLVTYSSSHEPSNPNDTHRVVLKIFAVRTGEVIEFEGSADEFGIGGAGGMTGVSWPVFRWGGGKDDKYFAHIGKNVVSIYDTDTYTLIDNICMEFENVMDISWSPTDPILALFVPEHGGGNQPARVSLVQIPSQEILRQKNLFSVSDCKMYWQSNGDYLAVKVDRYTKTKKSTFTAFELFRIKERDIPVEVLELENKNDKVIAFAWEPKGHRFAVIHGNNTIPDVSFYSMHTGKVSKLTTLKGKLANALYWSPAGRFIVLAGLKNLNGQLEFYNVDALQTMTMAEHYKATDIEWDPTGRYVATVVCSVNEMESGLNIWTFNGELLYRVPKDNLFQFSWRPRPPSLLTREQEEEISNNLEEYREKYEREDQAVLLKLIEQERERHRVMREEWDRWLCEWRWLHEEEKVERQRLRGGDDSDEEEEEEYEDKEVEMEEEVDVIEELLLD